MSGVTGSTLSAAEIKELKSRVRVEFQALVKRLSSTEKELAATQAGTLLRQQDCWRSSASILFYSPRGDELDLSVLCQEALRAGKIVTLPRFESATDSYVAGRVESNEQKLHKGKFGLLEPNPMTQAFPLNQLDLILVPGVAFDLSGRRLGRGRGYYDRLLENVRGIKCGVAFDQQVLTELPVEPHDAHLDCILTPTRWISFGRRTVVK